uniref:3-deoxy-D-manno-octulosonic acid transferase n=1 Tax=uncultured Verrucomicrobiota bacterium TaxID=156588 RepID=D2DXT6_9BACT|nr:three-deoxy-D-manno-octulosonic-acid transferase domain protein [uncultured Verrucomicrobiota bacterium]
MPQSLPAATRRSLLAYNLFFPLVFLALLPGFLRRMFRRGGFRENFGQRVGRYSAEARTRFATGRWWWIHSISVGETLVALKLAQELHRHDPALRLVITVTTSTGFALARDARADWLEVLYNPIDGRSIVTSALDLIHPERLILIEGEAWPNLLAECRARRIPVALVNARLSPRSERRFLKARYWIAPIFDLIDQVCVPEPTDVPRWQQLGIPAERLHVTGSIKFDSAIETNPGRTAEFRALLDSLGVRDDAPILVAGSTWAPEEKILAETLLVLRREFPKLFLIIVPRHIERSSDILRDLAPLGLRLCRRSSLPLAASADCDALLVDTTGELRDWYALATVVFVGKSLPGIAEVGGQNPAEPAALGKPIVLGPHMENFAALVDLLHYHQAAITIPDSSALTAALRDLLTNPLKRTTMGQQARAALDSHRGATNRTVEILTRSP